uniref:Uncharacterized protein n=1 Tax=Arundo donax TaxID=35708 RepID=A0A0A9DE04_ARUDO
MPFFLSILVGNNVCFLSSRSCCCRVRVSVLLLLPPVGFTVSNNLTEM